MKMVYAGVAIVAIVVILVVAGSAIANNGSVSIPTNNVQDCALAPKVPPVWIGGEINPDYQKKYDEWTKEWGHCSPTYRSNKFFESTK